MTPDFACCPTPAGCLQPRTEVCFARAGGHAEPPGVARWTGLRLPWSAHVVLPREHDKSNSDCSSPKGHCHRARRRSLFCNRRLAGQRAALDIRRIERERRRQHLAHRGGRQAALLPPFVKECGGGLDDRAQTLRAWVGGGGAVAYVGTARRNQGAWQAAGECENFRVDFLCTQRSAV